MIKTGKIELKKTASIVSGKPCEEIVNGEAVTKEEKKHKIKALRDIAKKLN